MNTSTSADEAGRARRARDLAAQIRELGLALGFSAVGFADIDLEREAAGYNAWLEAGHHGDMEYMAAHGSKRWRPAELVPGTRSVICVLLDYWPTQARDAREVLEQPQRAYLSRYALGRDYHKVLRQRLERFARAIDETIVPHRWRVFCDSAPVMEIPLALKAGLGWRGKHTLLLNRERGSLFFTGEIYTSLELPPGKLASSHCGTCRACIDVCPTRAIVAPYRLDARRCVSYLTIEHKGPIPLELRPLIGNRIYGCDDCQLVCPWNKFARRTPLPDFEPRHGLDNALLVELFLWNEKDFLARTEGSSIRRIGHERWLRNLAVALGNALRLLPQACERERIVNALCKRADDPSALVREHVAWALEQARTTQ
ncbi:MAG: tRNA epoxyqueuosine(34) reductase QueG [Casimicrobiaceae bacterium]|nr:tRNA epoxyqueuosine(34) reductase QueG [Casimicrobiaceae bacterium]